VRVLSRSGTRNRTLADADSVLRSGLRVSNLGAGGLVLDAAVVAARDDLAVRGVVDAALICDAIDRRRRAAAVVSEGNAKHRAKAVARIHVEHVGHRQLELDPVRDRMSAAGVTEAAQPLQLRPAELGAVASATRLGVGAGFSAKPLLAPAL